MFCERESDEKRSKKRQFQQYSLLLSEMLCRRIFQKLWEKGLAQYDDLEGIAWKWQSIDSCMIKAPTAQESAGAIWYGNQATASGFRKPTS